MKVMSPDGTPLQGVDCRTDPEAPFKKTKLQSLKRICLIVSYGALLSCLIILTLLSLSINLTPSPCDNFYEHVCSSAKVHLRNHQMPSIWAEARDYNEQLILSALSSGRARHNSTSRVLSFLVDLYRKWESESNYPAKRRLPADFDIFYGNFLFVFSRVYVDAAIEASSRHTVETLRESSSRMTEVVKGTLRRLLGPKDSLSKEALQRVTAHVGYENWFMNDTALDTWYGMTESTALPFNHSASYSDNFEAWQGHNFAALMNHTGSFIRDSWEKPAGKTIPWAVPFEQRIFLPLGYLFPPAFHHNSSLAAAYGSIGFSTAHELLHNLDLPANPSFEGAAQCLTEQYSAIREPRTGLSLRGAQTIDEDIADNGAIRAAFEAYRYAAEGTATPETDRQFFVSFAWQLCNIDSTKALEEKIKTYSHTLDKYRVNVVLSNFEPFSRTFSCPLGSPMNPAHKCTVW